MVFYRARKSKWSLLSLKGVLRCQDRERSVLLGNCEKIEKLLMRGVGFEPTQAYAIGASARPL